MNDREKNTQQNNEDFSLYTEKIVVNPFVRYKKIFAVIKFIVLAVLFGLISAAVMAWAYPKFLNEGKQTTGGGKDALVLNKDEFPSDAIIDETVPETKPVQSGNDKPTGEKPTGQNPTTQNPTEQDPIETEPVLSYVELLEKIQKSIVIISDTPKKGTIVPPMPGEEQADETVGVIIGELTGRYLVLTSNKAISGYSERIVKIGDEAEVRGNIVSSDIGTDLALVAFNKDDLTDYEKTLVAVAQLDNSYAVKQGDAFVAAGKLYGKTKAADKGFVTSIASEMGTDNCYGVINAGIRAVEGDYCFLFNGKGNVIGVSKYIGKDAKFVANGISDFKSLIEKLSSNSDIIYLGIKGTNVTSSMVTNYKLPYGIYVTDVAIDSPAFKAGLQMGDVITGVDGTALLAMQQLSDKLYGCYNGQQITLSVKRPGMTEYKDMTFTATLSVR